MMEYPTIGSYSFVYGNLPSWTSTNSPAKSLNIQREDDFRRGTDRECFLATSVKVQNSFLTAHACWEIFYQMLP